MNSRAFESGLKATGYLTRQGDAAAGLVRSSDDAPELRSIMKNDRVGLKADAVFSARRIPVAIFKDAGDVTPSEGDIRNWHEAAWNLGVAPLLWIITPTEIRLYDCYSSPTRNVDPLAATRALDQFALASEPRLRRLDQMCGRLATETGTFWSSAVGKKIDRRHRVDHTLLAEINALEERLTQVDAPTTTPDPTRVKAARDFAQRLIGRCVFTWYLIDRKIAQRFLPKDLAEAELADMFATPEGAFRLFDWLRDTFNGDLFPMDDPGAERRRLSQAHLALLRNFIQMRSLVPGSDGQGRLFKFRFDAIPIDLLSSIYQQFARSSAGGAARVEGLHYTPIELVHLTLDPVFEGLQASARVLDPTCGSGAFLVEAFRRLVWKNAQGGTARRSVVREILYERLFGIDINRSALGIAAFSLYLAALEFDDQPILDAADLKFDRLIGRTLFEADARGELPKELAERPFDAIVGNPPWTFDSSQLAPRRDPFDASTARPRRSPDQSFLHVAANLAGETGRIGMVIKASPLFSRDPHAVAARNSLLRRLAPAAVVSLSALRKEELFPDASGPALLFFARCVLSGRGEQVLAGAVPWTPDFRRSGVFHVGPGEFRSVPLSRLLETPPLLKAATFGSVRDGWLIERLERDFPTLEDLLDRAGIRKKRERAQGFKVKGREQTEPPRAYYDLKTLEPEAYRPFRQSTDGLVPFEHRTLHRTRQLGIFRGPLLICPKASFTLSSEPGRYSATVNPSDLLYTENFYGISFASHDPRWAYVLSAILNSSVTSLQLAFGGGTWGLERATVEPNDLLSLRVPDLAAVEDLEPVLAAEAESAAEPRGSRLEAMDDAVFHLYGMGRDEAILARDSVARARMLLFEGHSQRRTLIKPPSPDALKEYAGALVSVVDGYLRAQGHRHMEATVYSRPTSRTNWVDGTPGLAAVRLTMSVGAPLQTPVVHFSDSREPEHLTDVLLGRVQTDLPPYLGERRQLRIYLDDDLFIVKQNEARHWSRTAGLNDADAILADHWFGTRHAVAQA